MNERYPKVIDEIKHILWRVNSGHYSFNEYLDILGPAIAKLLPIYLLESRDQFESEKHPDCDKYLYTPLKNYLENNGKLHRPCLCVASYLMCGGAISEIEKVLPVACSIEVFQAAALIHDDIADSAQLRRGKPCLHIQEGEGIALNSGDFGLSLVIGNVIRHLSKTDCSQSLILQIVDCLIKMEYMTIEGQAIDLGWARDERFDLTANDYFTMARKKTAYYSCALPCVLGALCAGEDEANIKMLEEFGIQTGVAFQVQDDILNLTVQGDKDFLSDITEGKRTLLVVKAFETADPKETKKLQKILLKHTSNKQQLKAAVKIIEKSGAIDYANNLIVKLGKGSKQIIKRMYDNKWADIVVSMSDWAIKRNI